MNSFTIDRKELWGLLRTMKPFMKQYTKAKALKIKTEIVFFAGNLTMLIPDCQVRARCKWLDATSDCFLFYCFFSAHKHYQPVMPDDSFRE